jgi:hypothetical protein
MADYYLPEIERHPNPLREDVQVIDHVSYTLSIGSVAVLSKLLQPLGLELYRNKQYSVTVAYSKNRIDTYEFNSNGLDFTQYYSLSNPLSFPIEDMSVASILDTNGNPIDVLMLSKKAQDFFKDIHSFLIHRRRAEWSQGEYLPYIELSRPSVLNLTQAIAISSPNEALVFDYKRFMRFGEVI